MLLEALSADPLSLTRYIVFLGSLILLILYLIYAVFIKPSIVSSKFEKEVDYETS